MERDLELEALTGWLKRNYAWRSGQDDEFVGRLIEKAESLSRQRLTDDELAEIALKRLQEDDSKLNPIHTHLTVEKLVKDIRQAESEKIAEVKVKSFVESRLDL